MPHSIPKDLTVVIGHIVFMPINKYYVCGIYAIHKSMKNLTAENIFAACKNNQVEPLKNLWSTLSGAGFEDDQSDLDALLNVISEFSILTWTNARGNDLDHKSQNHSKDAITRLRKDSCAILNLAWPNTRWDKSVTEILRRYAVIVDQGVNDELTTAQVCTAHARIFLSLCFDLDKNDFTFISLLKPTEDALNRLGIDNLRSLDRLYSKH